MGISNATRDSWKTLPLPAELVNLCWTPSYTVEEFGRMKKGVLPLEMEDKWFIFFEEPWLYFHRSWTGECIYAVQLESFPAGVSVVASWVNRDPEHADEGTNYDRDLLAFLIDALLLGKHADFPVPTNVPTDVPAGIYQHAVVGRAYPEKLYPVSDRPTRSLWSQIRQLFIRQ